MEQFIILVRKREWENDSWSDFFTVLNSDNPEQAFRNAIKEYLLTEEGIVDIKESSEDFNWGDAIIYVPNHIWEKHGIHPISEGENITFSNPLTITVDQDEVLIPKEYYQLEE